MIDHTQTFMYCTVYSQLYMIIFCFSCLVIVLMVWLAVQGCCVVSHLFSLFPLSLTLSLFLSFSLAPCVVNGVTHASGTSFTAPDGCNTW